MKRGTLLVLEGLDGSGKSTQLPRLAARLRRAGHAVVETREPYDCPAGRRIRQMARCADPLAPEQELAWFVEQRRDHVRQVIQPALAAGRVVLCDRYFPSTVAYQGARGLDPETILRENEAAFPVPDLAILLLLPPEQGLERIAARGGRREPAFEGEAFLRQVDAQFRRMERPYLVRVDARGAPEAVEERIARVVSERLGLL